jgi:MT-A70
MESISHPGRVQEGGLVALWMTHRERHWRFVERELLPGWGLAPIATWLWLKAADDGRPVAPLVRESCQVQGLRYLCAADYGLTVPQGGERRPPRRAAAE